MAKSVRLDPAALRQLLESKDGEVAQEVLRRTNRVLNAARRGCPVDEGRLRNSLKEEIRTLPGAVVGRVGTNVDYAVWVHEGTGVYAGKGPIKPVRARVLRWPVKNNSGAGRRRYKGGKTSAYAYAKQVKGVRGRPFLRNALSAARG